MRSWAWSTGCASSLLAADGAATVALSIPYLQGKMRRQNINPPCVVQMVAQGVVQSCAFSKSQGICYAFYKVILCNLSSP